MLAELLRRLKLPVERRALCAILARSLSLSIALLVEPKVIGLGAIWRFGREKWAARGSGGPESRPQSNDVRRELGAD